MKRKLTTPLLVFALLMLHHLSFGQRKVSGVVSDASGGSLPGVSVVIKGTSEGTITDLDGNYSIMVPNDEAILLMSFIGFKSKEVPVGARSVIDVSLAEDTKQLSEVVVTAFGIEQEKASLGYAVESLGAKELTRASDPSMLGAMQGKVSGVQITNSGGAPGMSSRIIIRGITSLNPNSDNQPLFVVDGIPIDNSTDEGDSDRTPRGLTNRAADINPNDIESISILKGAAATALYGVRAGNGAVIITTKKGEAGKVTVNFKSTAGIQQINRFPDFQENYGQGYSGDYNPEDFWPSWGAPIEAVQTFEPTHRYYDNNRNTMETGTMFENYLSVSGGNEKSTFYLSLSNLDQNGVIPSSSWGRTTAKLSGTIKASQKADFSGSVSYTNSGGKRVPHDRVFERLMYWANTQDVEDYLKPDGTQKTYGNTNPIYDAEKSIFEDDVNRVVGNLKFNYKFTDWLSFQYRIGGDFYSDSRTDIDPGPTGIPGETVLNGSDGYIAESRITSRDLNATAVLTFNKNISDKFGLTVRVGNDIFDRSRNTVRAFGSEFVVPQLFRVTNTITPGNYQYFQQNRLVGVYGDIMLNYDGFAYLNITGRNDFTSTLAKDNRSFFYPSFSTGIILSEIIDMPSQVTFAKVRASYAEVGKDTDPYQTSVIYASDDPINGQLGFTRGSSLGEPTLKPERTESIELGLDARFFKNRLGVDLSWYKTNSKDQIIPVPVSNATGYTRLITNAGEIENKGIELLLTGTPVKLNNFNWDISVNFTRNRNEVIDIREGIENIELGDQFGYAGSSVSMILERGAAYGNLYGTSYSRYYTDGAPEDLNTLNKDLPIVIGADGFPERNSDQLILGNAQPDWLAGITNTVSYKGLTLSCLVDIRWGIDQFSQFDNFYSAFGKLDYSNNRNNVVIFDGVTDDGAANAKQVWLGQGIGPDYQDYGAGFYRNDYRGVSENFVQDASFVKLRNITLSYDLPQSIMSATPFKMVTLSASANNIILWTPWTGYDPESFSSGAGGNATAFSGLGHPGVSSYLFTLNLTL